VKGWHEETSNFHLLFGEMTVTLDDVSSLLHLPIDGMLLPHESISRDEAVELMETYLGLVRVMLLLRSKRPKVHIADLATWRGSSRSV